MDVETPTPTKRSQGDCNFIVTKRSKRLKMAALLSTPETQSKPSATVSKAPQVAQSVPLTEIIPPVTQVPVDLVSQSVPSTQPPIVQMPPEEPLPAPPGDIGLTDIFQMPTEDLVACYLVTEPDTETSSTNVKTDITALLSMAEETFHVEDTLNRNLKELPMY